ncbi:hypothetical protein ACOME3_007483 [Neoechinorhynchus agilis]
MLGDKYFSLYLRAANFYVAGCEWRPREEMSSFVFGQKLSKVKPPERGSFPLDRSGQCKSNARMYLQCMADSRNQFEKCKSLARDYLECRMAKNLMKGENLDRLGFSSTILKKSNSDVENNAVAQS